MIVVAGVAVPGYSPFERQDFDLHSFQLFEFQLLEQCAACGREVVLHWVSEREKIAPGVFQPITQRN